MGHHSSFAQPPQTVEDFVQPLMISGMAMVRNRIPSLQTDQIEVRLDKSNGQTEVVGVGDVEFLKSEWKRTLNQSGTR